MTPYYERGLIFVRCSKLGFGDPERHAVYRYAVGIEKTSDLRAEHMDNLIAAFDGLDEGRLRLEFGEDGSVEVVPV